MSTTHASDVAGGVADALERPGARSDGCEQTAHVEIGGDGIARSLVRSGERLAD